ncbi:Unannotated [Lentimonas sp. CC19]|nr:Unannotated [Lentimonas sp. CC4]CAA6684537.1 Unannotated [Lentimonas sp. CC6]CAA6693878.1 Unannotated [Lentimonas sp. CC19]CAA6695192.1 Unannotated [Lentimonas sp. CC10]CAA7069733.1 Unannotated [Lentimonas sp. CC11]CAA7171221.1 Unannotated [Lentimonas sp. CC21]CAA7183250.1 Unannotated [Lentimonas sp. CC8]
MFISMYETYIQELEVRSQTEVCGTTILAEVRRWRSKSVFSHGAF